MKMKSGKRNGGGTAEKQGQRGGLRSLLCGSQGENSINCLARHKIMLHYRLARLRQKPPNVAQGSALRCRDRDGTKTCEWESERESARTLMDRRHGRYVQHTPKSASKPCGSDLASVFASLFPSMFFWLFFSVFFFISLRCCCCCW